MRLSTYACALLLALCFGGLEKGAAQSFSCPDVVPNGGASTQTLPCGVGCTTVTATMPDIRSTTQYTVQSVSYSNHESFQIAGSTAVIVNQDDIWSGPIQMPFKFCYYGGTYGKVNIGANGILSFDSTLTSTSYCPWKLYSGSSTPIPFPNSSYNRAILGVYHDIDPSIPSTGKAIEYILTGTAPCRKLIVNYRNIAQYGTLCNALKSTFQIILYENTNVIDFYIQDKPYCLSENNGFAICGLQDWGRINATTVPGLNCSVWGSANYNQGYRFIPNGTASQLINVQLLNGSTQVATATTATTSAGVITATFSNICPTADTTLYTVRAKYFACSGDSLIASAPLTVQKQAVPTVTSVTAANPVGCAATNGTITLAGLVPGAAYTYSYTFNGGTPIAGSATATTGGTVVLSGLATGSYSNLSITSTASGCTTAVPGTTTVGPGQLGPLTSVLGQPTVCTGSNGSIAISGLPTAAPATYTYTLNGSTPVSGSGNISSAGTLTINGLGGGTYTNLVITATGCSTAPLGPFTLNSSASPVLTTPAVAQIATCGGTGSISFSGLLPGALYPFQYTVNGTPVTGTATTNGSGGLTLAGLAAGTYTGISVTYSGCPSNVVSGPLTITAPVAPTVTAAASGTPVCQGTTLTLTAASATATTYSWTGPNGYTATGAVQTFSNVQPAAAGTYTVTGTNSATGCTSAPVTVTVAITPTPATPIAGSNSPVCDGAPLNLTASGPAGATYAWTGPSGFTAAAQNPTLTAAASAAGTYSVTATVSGCTSAAATTTVVVKPTPNVATASGTPISTCGGTNGGVLLTGLPASVPLTVSYMRNGVTQTATGTTGTTGTFTLSGLTAGTYTAFTATVAGCTGTPSTLSVTLSDPPTPAQPTAAANGPVCAGSVLNLSTPTVAGATYAWTGPNGFSSSAQNPSLAASAASSGTYTVTVTVAGCTSPAGTTTAVVNPVPATPAASSNSPVCAGGTLTLSATTLAGVSYNWTGPGGFTASVQNPTLPNATTANSGSYQVTATAAGCTSQAGVVAVTVNPTPSITTAVVGSAVTTCGGANGTIVLSGLPAAATLSFTYTRNGVSQSASGTTTSAGTFTLTGLNAGSYGAFVATQGACSSVPFAGPVTLTDPAAPAAPTALSNGPLCAGATLNLTATTVSGATYLWTGPNGFSSTLQNPTLPGVTTSAAGTYSVVATVTGCVSAPGTVPVTVNPIPAPPTAGSNSPVCSGPGNTLTLTATAAAGATYSWTGPNGFSSSSQNPNITPVVTAATGTYQVTATLAGCPSAPATTTVVVNPTPVAPAPANTIYCQYGTAFPLTATNNNVGGSLLWYTAATGGTGTATAPTPSTLTPGITTWYVSALGANGCESGRMPLTVTVTAKPAAPTVTATPIQYCQGQTAAPLMAGGSNLIWYTTPTGGTGVVTVPVPSTASIGSTTWYVSQVINGCVSDRAPITVIVTTTPPPPAVSSPVSYCQGSPASALSATGTALLWYTTATGGTGSTAVPTPSTAIAGTTTWYVSQTTGTCEGPRAAIVITVYPSLPAPPVTAAVGFCQGTGTQSLAPYATGTGLRWYPTATGGAASTAAPQINTATTGTVTWYVSQSNTSCEGPRAAIAVTVSPAPAAPTVNFPSTYCQYATIPQLTATGQNLLWYYTATGGSGQPAIVPNASVPGTTTYYVTQTVNGCESPRAPLSITVIPQPPAPTVNSPSWCQFGTPSPLVAVGQNLLWYTTPVGGTGTAAAPTFPPNSTSTGVFVYYVTQTVAGCVSPRAMTTITIKPKPAPPTVANPIVYCQYASPAALTAVGQNLLWYTAPIGQTGLPTAPVPSTQYAGPQNYYVTQTVDGCESDRSLAAVDVRTQPNATFVASSPWVCSGETLSFTYFGNGLATWTYNWQVPRTATIESGDTSQGPLVVRFTGQGRQTVYLVVDNGGCLSTRVGLDITVRPLPVVAVHLPENGCVDAPVTISLDSASNGIETFRWDFGSGTVTSGSFSGGPYEVVWHEPGPKIVTATALLEGCSNKPDGDTITIHIKPEARILWDKPTRICANDSLLLQASQAIGNHYAWSPAGLFGPATAGATGWARVPRPQRLRLDVTSEWGCVASDSILVETQPCCDLFVPNAFTPNGDGRNDVFGILSPGNYTIGAFRVMNRWGQIVWSTGTQDRSWDGTQAGEPVPAGVYFYYIRYKCSTGEEFEKSGDLTVIR